VSFQQVTAKSLWIADGSSHNTGKIIIPWEGASGWGAIGPYYVAATPPGGPTDLNSFRFDEVSKTLGTAGGAEQGYAGNTSINLYLGPNKVIGASGTDAWHTNIYSKADTTYRVIPNGLSQISALEAKNGITMTGTNGSGQSAQIGWTSGRGIIDAGMAVSAGQSLSRGTVATYGTGLNSWDGYVISGSGTANVYDVAFVKTHGGPDWGIRSGSNGSSPTNQDHWGIYVNGGDNNAGRTPRMSLNATSPGLVNNAYSLSINGTVFSRFNFFYNNIFLSSKFSMSESLCKIGCRNYILSSFIPFCSFLFYNG
jgi:hypothetical protein